MSGCNCRNTVTKRRENLAQVDGAGHGLANIRERAAALGGEARIDAEPGHGTSILVRLPL